MSISAEPRILRPGPDRGLRVGLRRPTSRGRCPCRRPATRTSRSTRTSTSWTSPGTSTGGGRAASASRSTSATWSTTRPLVWLVQLGHRALVQGDRPDATDADVARSFERMVRPSLRYAEQVGNSYSGSRVRGPPGPPRRPHGRGRGRTGRRLLLRVRRVRRDLQRHGRPAGPGHHRPTRRRRAPGGAPRHRDVGLRRGGRRRVRQPDLPLVRPRPEQPGLALRGRVRGPRPPDPGEASRSSPATMPGAERRAAPAASSGTRTARPGSPPTWWPSCVEAPPRTSTTAARRHPGGIRQGRSAWACTSTWWRRYLEDVPEIDGDPGPGPLRRAAGRGLALPASR